MAGYQSHVRMEDDEWGVFRRGDARALELFCWALHFVHPTEETG